MQPTMAELVDTELKKGWDEPASPLLSSRYKKERNRSQTDEARLAIWAASLIYISFSLLDVFLIADVAQHTTMARLALAVISLVFIQALIRSAASAAAIDVACAVIVVVAYVTWLWIASTSQHALSVSYYMTFGTIFMMVCNLFFNFSWRISFVASSMILACFFYAISAIVPVSAEYTLAIGTLYVATYLLTLYVNWKLNVERYSVFLNAVQAEIRQQVVTERGAALLRLSNTDSLTGVANRRAIDVELRSYWEAWQATGQTFAVILIDIDFFKKFNDHYGHQEGDRCLILVAEAVAALVERHQGSVGRFGGEEFIVVARAETRDDVAAIAEEIRRTVEELRLVHDQRPDGECVITVSVGGAFSKDLAGAKVENLVSEADRALYGAKASGRNYARLFDKEDPERNDDSENIAALLRTALAKNLLSLVYQPIKNAKTGDLEAAEALMRLKLPGGKTISPAVFIPIAERTGLILELGRWAIRTACREMIASDLVPIVSVNVSAVQLKVAGFSMSVAAILGEMGIAPGRLAFEITEGLEIESHPEVLRCVRELQQIGVKIWLDDFGTGFAGLSCLRAIDFDTVKIDRTFLHDSPTPKGATMLLDIIRLIENRGNTMIVEGVENERQMNLLKLYDVNLLQGFHIGRPVPAREFASQHVGESVEAPAAVRSA